MTPLPPERSLGPPGQPTRNRSHHEGSRTTEGRTGRRALPLLGLLALLASWPTALHADTFTVANTADSGGGSLRQAILDANADPPGPHTIELDPAVIGTIVLESALPPLQVEMEVLGPGASVLTVSGDDSFRVFIVDAAVTITGLTIADGSALDGAGIIVLLGGELTISNSTLADNSAGARGGGILVVADAQATISNSTLAGNSSGDLGGGIYVDGDAQVTISNSTLSGNSSADRGGGIRATTSAQVTISNSTLAGNSTATGGGGGIDIGSGATASFKSSIVADSPGGNDCAVTGTLTALGVNLDTDGTCSGFTQVSSAALDLGPLQGNGGPTETHALAPASVAVDAASDCEGAFGDPVTADQRGVPRPQGPECDVGAFELTVAPPPSVLEIPTLGTWGLASLAVLLAAMGLALRGRSS